MIDWEGTGYHAGAGALLVLPLVVIPHPLASVFVFTIWGLLREQAQRHRRGASFAENWLRVWNLNKLVEGVAWGIGAGIAHTVALAVMR